MRAPATHMPASPGAWWICLSVQMPVPMRKEIVGVHARASAPMLMQARAHATAQLAWEGFVVVVEILRTADGANLTLVKRLSLFLWMFKRAVRWWALECIGDLVEHEDQGDADCGHDEGVDDAN